MGSLRQQRLGGAALRHARDLDEVPPWDLAEGSPDTGDGLLPGASFFTNDVESARVDVCGSSERADPEPGPPALSIDQRQDSREPALGASLDDEQVCVRRKGAEIRAHPFRPVEGLVV